MNPRQIWKAHCKAAREILAEHGVIQALDFLVGQKLAEFWELSETEAEYKKELQAFIYEIWSVFDEREFNLYFGNLERTTTLSPVDPDDIDTAEMPTFQEQKKRDFYERAKVWLLRN